MPRNEFKFKPLRQSRAVAHPLVRELVTLMNEQGIGRLELTREAGVPVATFDGWRKPPKGNRRRPSPNFANLEACFNVVGYSLKPVKQDVPIYDRQDGRRRQYVFKSPTGEEHTVWGMSDFCAENKLDVNAMYSIIGGQNPKSKKVTVKSYKGWGVRRVDAVS